MARSGMLLAVAAALHAPKAAAFSGARAMTRSAALAPGLWHAKGVRRSMASLGDPVPGTGGQVCLVVTVEIVPEHMEEFLRVITADADGSRGEPGCLRFDVVRDSEDANKFVFYEVYEDEASVAFHKAQAHFALWTDFKGSGGVVSQSVIKGAGVSIL